jgi:hypothetical protein
MSIITPGQIMFKTDEEGHRIPRSVHLVSTVESCTCKPYHLLVNGKYCVDELSYNHSWTSREMTPQERTAFIGKKS